MSIPVDADSRTEAPVGFLADGIHLHGIMTVPAGRPRATGVVLLNGGAFTPSPGRNRFSVRLARRLAVEGFRVLRFDWHGTGESAGKVVRYSLNRPFTADVVGAVEELLRWGVEDVLLIGRCGGARFALSAIAQLPRLRGLAFISLPLREFATQESDGRDIVQEPIGLRDLAGLLDRKRRRRHLRVIYYSVKRLTKRVRAIGRPGYGRALDWLSDTVVDWLRQAVERGVALFFIYGTDEVHAHEFRQAQRGPVGGLMNGTQVCMLDGPVHDLTTLEIQEQIMARIVAWATTLTPARDPVGAAP